MYVLRGLLLGRLLKRGVRVVLRSEVLQTCTCKLGASCSNASRTLNTLKLYDTGRVGLDVYTITAIHVGDALGEYCGELAKFPAVVEAPPKIKTVKQTVGTLFCTTRSLCTSTM